MFENFESFDIQTSEKPHVTIHGIISKSSGPPLVLLHGFPQTHHIWHLVCVKLRTRFTIIVLDLRGYGASSKPSGVDQYAKSVMARDVAVVIERLGYSSYYVCAHDRGARVAHKLLVEYPERVNKAILLDICPTLAMYGKTDMEFAKAYWHWFFLIQKEPLPEMMIGNDPRKFAELFMGGRYASLDMWHPEAWEEYVKNLKDRDAVHAMCEDYRASASVDLEEARQDIVENRLINVPLRVLWGKHGVIEQCFEAVDEWKKVAENGVIVDGSSIDCGHYIPEEAPEIIVKNIIEFFV